jgi:hypothetical protein
MDERLVGGPATFALAIVAMVLHAIKGTYR